MYYLCPTSRGTSVTAPSALASFPPVSLCSHSVACLAVYVKIPSENARSERPYHPALSQVHRSCPVVSHRARKLFPPAPRPSYAPLTMISNEYRHEKVLNCSTKFTQILESYSRSSSRKKFKHMKHIQQTNFSKTNTLSNKSRVFTLNTLSYTIKPTYITKQLT